MGPDKDVRPRDRVKGVVVGENRGGGGKGRKKTPKISFLILYVFDFPQFDRLHLIPCMWLHLEAYTGCPRIFRNKNKTFLRLCKT